MGYRPPKGVRPPQLEGKRTGRPPGSVAFADAWRDVLWAHEHWSDDRADFPSRNARLWWAFAREFPYQIEAFLVMHGKI